MSWAMMACLTCWAQAGNDSGITCKWLLVGSLGPMAAVIVALFIWGKTKDLKIDELHKAKDTVQDSRLQDFKDRYDKLSHRKNSSASDT